MTNALAIPVPQERQLSEQQRIFVKHLVHDGVDRTEAARLAGYTRPEYMGLEVLGHPGVQLAIRAEQRALIRTTLSTQALSTVREIMQDKGAPAAARGAMARTALEMAGFMSEEGKGTLEKNLAEMSSDELKSLYHRLEDKVGPVTINADIGTKEGQQTPPIEEGN